MPPENAKPAPQFSPSEIVQVLLPLPVDGPYDYRVGGAGLDLGDVVRVPLGPRQVVGVVWGAGAGMVAAHRLKTVLARLDCPSVPAVTRRFVDWVAGYNLVQPGQVLKMVLNVPEALEPRPLRTGLALAQRLPPFKSTPARAAVLAAVGRHGPQSPADLARLADVGAGVVAGLVKAGALCPVPLDDPPPPPLRLDHAPDLSPAQAQAAQHLCAMVGAGAGVALLDGVTGSGKTEVYFQAVAQAVARGGQVLVLLPEIALSAAFLDRFERRFGQPPALWHSDLSPARRRKTWRAVAEGQVAVVAGARSALFLPFPRLDLIVVDEEHDGAFKQEEGVSYHARDMAVARGHLGKVPVVLASATPSLESWVNVDEGRYGLVHLPDRHGGAELPPILPVDLRRDPPPRGQWLSPVLAQAIAETLAAGEQAMLFLNRRGYAPLTLCRSCGHRLQCPHCSAWLVDHRARGRLCCHHCGYVVTLPPRCPQCEAEGSFVACGPGVERIAEEAAHRFPQARLAVLASDTMGGADQVAQAMRDIADHKVDLLVGTQIVAKGHHFPMLTLVGVVDADLGLEGGDLRAGERTFQLLSQVAGRAGRAERPGRVMLQTYDPAHPVIAALAAGDRDGFLAREKEARQAARMPPFGRLAALILSGTDESQVDQYARALARSAPGGPMITVLGPAPAPLALLQGRHRRRFLIKAQKKFSLQSTLRTWLGQTPPPNGVKIQVDIDPQSFF